MRTMLVRAFASLVSLVLSFAVLELLVRVTFGAPLLSLGDLRTLRMAVNDSSAAMYDPLLGWTLRPGVVSGGFHTIDFGIRKNRRPGVCAPGEANNLLEGTTATYFRAASLLVTVSDEVGPLAAEPITRLGATDLGGEHYASIPWRDEGEGAATFSVYVHRQTSGGIRLQLLDAELNGAIVDFEYGTGVYDLIQMGALAAAFVAEPTEDDDWLRLSLTTELLVSSGFVRLQLATADGLTDFTDPTITALVQGPMVERGDVASAFCGGEGSGTEDVSRGGILAVGDSFTAGSEVRDEFTWPAYLERTLGTRVHNAGVGSYGVDQAILRAERLLPELEPQMVLIGALVPDDVLRVGYSVYGRPKPYFVRERGQFVQRNLPVPTSSEELSQASIAKRLMSRVMTLNLIFERVWPDWWFAEIGGQNYTRVGNNPSAVTCYLLQRLATTLGEARIPAAVVLQHGGWAYARGQDRSTEAESLANCSRALGYAVIDEYDSLREVASRSLDDLQAHYVMHDGNQTYGHMSAIGNELVAGLIADRLRQPMEPPELSATVLDFQVVPGEGVNLLTGTAVANFQAARVTVSASDEVGPLAAEPSTRIQATDVAGEHYAVLPWQARSAGLTTFSLYVQRETGASLRLQLLDTESNGVIVDFEYATGLFDFVKAGEATRLDFVAEPTGDDDWVRLSVTAELLASSGTVLIQPAAADRRTTFADPTIGVLVQAPMVEGGGVASEFCDPDGGCRPRLVPGEGVNLLTGTAVANFQAANVTVSASEEVGPLAAEPSTRIQATDVAGEHYAVLPWQARSAGLTTFSLYVHRRARAVRLQLLDTEANGAVVDFESESGVFALVEVGEAFRSDFARDPTENDDWLRLSVSAQLPGSSGTVVIQLATADRRTVFGDPTIEVLVQAPMVERGGVASEFCDPGDCSSD